MNIVVDMVLLQNIVEFGRFIDCKFIKVVFYVISCGLSVYLFKFKYILFKMLFSYFLFILLIV